MKTLLIQRFSGFHICKSAAFTAMLAAAFPRCRRRAAANYLCAARNRIAIFYVLEYSILVKFGGGTFCSSAPLHF